MKLQIKKCSKNQDKSDTDNNESLAGREVQNIGKTVREPLTFDLQIDDTYEQVISWQRSIFFLPKGSIGKQYKKEITKLLTAWNKNTYKKNQLNLS